MSATYFPYYPQPQYAVPPFYGSQLQRAQEIHSFSVRPHSDLPGSQLQENSHSSSSSTGPKKKNRWTDTEEKILVELFGENEDKLRYKAFSSPEWLLIARQLHSQCKEQNVDSDKTPQQCKNKLANLTKKYKDTKDKLRLTGYGRGGDVPSDNESEESEDIIPKHFNDMDEILGKRESINPRHVLESSHVPNSDSPEMSELERDILEKDALDEEICRAAQKQSKGLPRMFLLHLSARCLLMEMNPITTSHLPLQNPSFLRVKAKIKSLWQAHCYRRGARLMWKKSYQESAPLMQRKGHRKKAQKKGKSRIIRSRRANLYIIS